MFRTRRLLAICALVAIAAAAGCGGDETAASQRQPAPPTPTAKPVPTPIGPEPCTVVSRGEASAALGADAAVGRSKREARGGTCIYAAGSTGNVLVAVFSGPLAEIKSRFEYAAARPKVRDEFETVSGIGDRAIVRGGTPGATLFFYKGTVLVSIVLTTGRSRSRAVTEVTTLGKAAAGRI